MTPVLAGISFTTNTKIDGFNAALKAFAEESGLCTYIDIASGLKTDYNSLVYSYQGGDGIHLAPPAYAVILDEVCTALQEKAELPPDH